MVCRAAETRQKRRVSHRHAENTAIDAGALHVRKWHVRGPFRADSLSVDLFVAVVRRRHPGTSQGGILTNRAEQGAR